LTRHLLARGSIPASLLGPPLVVAISTAVGVLLGLLGAYRRRLDMAGADWDLLFGPALPGDRAVATRPISTAVIAISITHVPLLARCRSVVIVEKQKAASRPPACPATAPSASRSATLRR
jgi:hypothetical protein